MTLLLSFRLVCYDYHVEQLEQQNRPTKTKHRDYSITESERMIQLSTILTFIISHRNI
jgi:hypothetical protein